MCLLTWLELLRLSTFSFGVCPGVLLMLSGSWPQTSLAEFHEGTPFRSTQVILVRSLSSIPRVLGLWVSSSSLTTLRYPILTRTISCLTALRGLAFPSVPGFVVLLAPSQPSSCGSSWSRRVDYTGSRSRDGCFYGYFAVLRPLPPPAAGTPAGFLVQTLFLAPLESSEGHSFEMHCSLAWLGMFARDFLVTNNGFIYLGPGSASLGSSVDDVPGLSTQDPVAQCLSHRCVLHSRCLFRSVLFQTWPCLRLCFPGVFNAF